MKYKILVIMEDTVAQGISIHSQVIEFDTEEDATKAGRLILAQMSECLEAKRKGRSEASLVKEIIKLY